MMHSNGLNKVMEESAELIQVAAKWQCCEDSGLGHIHYDSSDMRKRAEEEIADVEAACQFLIETRGLDILAIQTRKERKLQLFRNWSNE